MVAAVSHIAAQSASTATPSRWPTPSRSPDAWHLQHLRRAATVFRSELVCETLATELERAIAEAPPARSLAMAHTVNGIAGLACAPGRRASLIGWGDVLQLSVRWIAAGANVSHSTAHKALGIVMRLLGATTHAPRANQGFIRVSPEAVAACRRVVDRIGAPEPAVSRAQWTGRIVQIDIPSGMVRGQVRCPCGQHANGDRNPSAAFDDERGRCTCQKTGAVYGRLPDGSGWVEIRPPLVFGRVQRVAATAQPTSPRVSIRLLPEDAGITSASEQTGRRVPDALRPDRRDAPWIMGRAPCGRLLTSTLHREPDPYDAARIVSRRTDSPSGRPREWRSLAQIMRWADRHYGGPAAEERAHVLAYCGRHAPDRLVSTERYVLDTEASTWDDRADGSRYVVRPVYRSVGTDLRVLDIDGLEPRDTTPDPVAVERIVAACRAAGWRVVTVVATSRTGIQIVLRLPGWCPKPELIYRDLGVRRALMDAGQRVIAALGRGGHVDPAVWAPNRRIRRPGWRTKNGEAVRARLWWDCEHGFNDRP